MEINVTHMIEDSDEMGLLSGSVFELGERAGKFTWNNSCEYARNHPLLTSDEMRDAAKQHIREFGAWSEDEINAWSEDELQGFIVQDVAASIREMEPYDSPEDYLAASERGETSSRLYRGDDGQWWFYLGM